MSLTTAQSQQGAGGPIWVATETADGSGILGPIGGSSGSSASATGGTSTYSATGGSGNALLTTTLTQVGTVAAHSLYGIAFVNTGAADAYVQFWDALIGSITLGTTAPKFSVWVPTGGAWEEKFPADGRILFATGIVIAATTTPTGLTAPATGILGTLEYK